MDIVGIADASVGTLIALCVVKLLDSVSQNFGHIVSNGCRSDCCGSKLEIDGDDDTPQSTPIHIRRSVSEHGTERLELV